MTYSDEHGWENLNKAMYRGVGAYDLPELPRVESVKVDNWIGFNFMLSCEEPEIHGVHFFVHDYQFMRAWNRPDAYIDKLKRFQAVVSPDFSTYIDFPMAAQIWNRYRNNWLGRYWSDFGVTVIPNIGWGDESSYSWCFDGMPTDSVVAVSSIGTQNDTKAQRLFLLGWEQMMERLRPRQIIFFGKQPKECTGNIIHVPAFHEKFEHK